MITTKMYKIGAAILIILSVILLIFYLSSRLSEANSRLGSYKNNTYSLMSGMKTLKSDSAGQTVQIQALTLEKSEFKKYRDSLTEVIDNLGIKLKNVQSTSTQKLVVEANTKAKITYKKDINDTTKTVGTAEESNKNIDVKTTIKNDSVFNTFNLSVTLNQITSIIPKHKFLFWQWGIKSIKQTITTNNPYVKLNYAEYIKIN